ncbi:MAG: protocatechuate 3,4-dioxygenase subunit alpha [Candidatus Eremiobacteraeota bacterium]|nr:protocatechuate 3,4-dioxygenase subunit alpha [Candidatus Eremiobacteraeota bacterium]
MIPSSSQTVGPFFKYARERPTWSDLTTDGARGERVRIAGRVLDGDGAPVPDALLEVWQANADGKYAHEADTQDKPGDPNFRGFGRACVDDDGRYAFTTVVPGSVPDASGAPQAPHVNVSIFARGLLRRLVTRVYFGDREDENARDGVLRSIADASARASLVAAREDATGELPTYRFNIILQGENETAFLDV